jgi:tRNA A-37 threonylcarbamoyl transferase component Bud32
MPRATWRKFVLESKGMQEFRTTMFSRLVPNLREIGLMSPRIIQHYQKVGLMQYFGGPAADKLTGEQMIADLDRAA